MRIRLDAKITTRDGHDAGTVKRVLLDPASLRITGFVVGTGGLLGKDVIVGDHDFSDAPSSDELALKLTKDELDQQPRFDATGFDPPPAGLAATMGYGYPSQAYLWPAMDAGAPPASGSRPALKKGDVVKDRDGDVVGVVEDVIFDESSDRLKGFLVRPGAGVERLFGGGQIAEISADDILRIVEGEVRIGPDREEISGSEQGSRTR
jgi:sporulation protein YlmC with PRC-barrel domain